MAANTIIYIKIRRSAWDDCLFHLREDLEGFELAQKIPQPGLADPDFLMMRVKYSVNLTGFQKRQLRRSISMYHGEVADIIHLGDKPSWISSQTKEMFSKASLIFIITYLTGLTSIKALSSLLLVQSLVLPLIPAAAAFFTKIYDSLTKH